MASDTSVANSVDPLSGFNGPSLIFRTVRASVADASLLTDRKTLESIHELVKNLELRSPEKLNNEAKRIVDDREELLDCTLPSITEKFGRPNPIAAKAKDKPQERRPGLGRARKKGTFSLKTSVSQPSVNLEPTFNIDELEDPDDFFDACERREKSRKEIQKQLGGGMDDLNTGNPSTRARSRRPGILGKSYNIKHRYSASPSEDAEMLVFSQETSEQGVPGEQGVPDACEDGSQDELINLDLDLDVSDVELASPMKKAESNDNHMLNELLSCDNEDLDGDRALNLLQERLNIRPFDMAKLNMAELHAVGKTSILSAGDILLKSRRSSVVVNSVNLNSKSPIEHHKVAHNPVNTFSSPKFRRSSFAASLSLLKKKFFFKPNPLKDPFSAMDVDFPESQSASPIQPIDRLHEHDDAPPNLRTSSELKSYEETETAEPTLSNADVQKVVESECSPNDQLVHENANIERASADNEPNEASSDNEPNEASSVNEPNEASADNEPNEVPNNANEETMNSENLNDSQSDVSVLQDGAKDYPSSKQPLDAELQPKGNQAILERKRKETGVNRIQKAHPMRKSIAECGTSFDTGVRRSKRIKMRPLEYWKGERFLYGRMDDSLKLLGVKYISPGKSTGELKVKPYISTDVSECKEVLEFAARY